MAGSGPQAAPLPPPQEPPRNGVRGWLGMLWPLLQQGGPVTMLVLLIFLYGLFLEIKRLHGNNEKLVFLLVEEKQAQITWLHQFVHCTPVTPAP